MSATTLTLPFKRFVAQASTAPARSKSSYITLMEENLAALQKCPWREAGDVPAALTDHDFTASTYISDTYDAFKMTGNYDSSAMTEIAYAGMAAYRFKMPDSALASGSEVALSSIALPISRDRFLRSGVRVAAVLSDTATPSADWGVVRGSGGILLSAQLPQTAAYLLAGAPAKDTLEIDLSSVDSGNPSAYLWIYLTLEDYTEHWDMYSPREQRLYAVEGSAMLVGGSAEFTFAGEVTADAAPAGHLVAEAGNYPRLTGETTGVFATMRHLNGDAVPFGSPPEVAAGDVAAGRNALYADLIKQRLDPIPAAMLANGGVRPGAGFTVFRRTAAELPSDTLGDTITTPRWDLAVAVLSLPFVIPAGGKSIELEWTAPTPAAGLVRLWLRQGELDESPDPAALSAPTLFTGAETTVGGYVLVATAPASAGALSAPIPAPPSAPAPATLLVTAYAPPESIALDSADTAMGVAALSADAPMGAVSGLDTLITPTITVTMR